MARALYRVVFSFKFLLGWIPKLSVNLRQTHNPTTPRRNSQKTLLLVSCPGLTGNNIFSRQVIQASYWPEDAV